MSARKGILITSGVVVLGVAVAAVWWLFSSGRLVYVAEPGNGGVASAVCGAGIVDEYNATAGVNEDDEYAVNADQRQTIVTKIKSSDGFSKDPTCHAILYLYAIYKEDKTSAQQHYDSLIALHEDGKYPNPALNETASLRYYKIQIESLSDGGATPAGE